MFGRRKIHELIRRSVLLATTAIYLLFSVGILHATHFCMGREASVRFFSAEAEKCYCSLFADERDHCCDDERGLLKLDSDQKSVTAQHIRIPHLYILDDLYTRQLVALQESPTDERLFFDPVPIPPKVPLFQRNCCLIFYDGSTVA